jgi:hypothetical protein
MTSGTVVPFKRSLLYAAVKARFSLSTCDVPDVGGETEPAGEGCGDQSPIFPPAKLEPEYHFDVTLSQFSIVALCVSASTLEEIRMSDVADKKASLRWLRNAALIALVLTPAVLAGCSQQAPPPPPPQPAPMAPPPPPPPPVRG